ncbi:MAG: hypothetical protein DBX59_10525 [Bacillota bacterium]|nr:MAG: hypothetical protein DBX59_10525 [Bacillota bacterium]
MNNFIWELMENIGLKQKDLAEIVGVSPAAVSKWNDMRGISVENLFSLSKLFNITIDELLAEQRANESIEDKWSRQYSINEQAARYALIDGKKDKALKYLEALSKANDRFFDLFKKKITNQINEIELREWIYLKQFYDVSIRRSNYFDDIQIINRKDNFDDFIISRIGEKVGENKIDAIIWELKKIYNITNYGVGITENREVVPKDDYYNDYSDDDDPLEYLKNDEDIFLAVYQALPQISKDIFVTLTKWNVNFLYELIKRGGNILYRPKDLNLINYDLKDLEDFEGEIKLIPELEEAQAVIFEIYDNYSLATYEQYQALKNHNEIERIEMAAKCKEKKPIKYWEYIKSR